MHMYLHNFLFREGIRIAKICNAKMILFENVPMITTKRVAKDSKELIIDLLKRELEEAGYVNYKEVVLDASKYGVPQRRKRFFILAAKDPKYHIDAPEEFPAVEKVSQGIPDVTKSMPPLGTNGSICSAVTFLISECITCTSG